MYYRLNLGICFYTARPIKRVCDVEDPRCWWLEENQQKVYPNLSKMAQDMISIPAMSAEPERLFSGLLSWQGTNSEGGLYAGLYSIPLLDYHGPRVGRLTG